MKRRTNRVKTKLLCLSLLATVVLYGCQSDVNDAFVEDQSSEQLLEAAKRMYNSVSSGQTMKLRTSGSEGGVQVEPLWDFLQTEQSDKYSVLEIGLTSEYRFNFATPESFAKAEEDNDPRYRLSKTSFIYITDKEDEREEMFMMTIVPDLIYLELTDFRPFKRMSYLYRDENFNGLIFYHNLSGDYVAGFRYENGEVTGTMQPDNNAPGFERPQTRLSCTQYDVTEVWEKCTFWGPGNASGEMLYISGYECSTYYGSTHSYQVCVDSSDSGGFPGFDSPSGGDNKSPNTTVTLNVVPGTRIVDLGDIVTFSVTLLPSVANYGVMYEIGKDNSYHTMTTTSTNAPYRRALLAPGRWSARAIVSLGNGRTITSQPVPIEVRYPDINRIQSNSTITTAMNAIWVQTKDATSSSGRQEFGFWIYANTVTSSLTFERGPTQSGSRVSGCVGTNASIDPGSPSENISQNPLTGGKFAVAHFHTHTPLTYCTGERGVGPSGSDDSWALRNGIPGLVYDYTGSYVSFQTGTGIIGGHNINAPAQVYTFGPSRRSTPF
ncbi:MAG: hypothetical protein LBI15_06655 [Dysgonamonadaceae bacterium]|jgi:hypothetical protein|nr:hypothetical protein [Dysgonamonadaceae bacterium]